MIGHICCKNDGEPCTFTYGKVSAFQKLLSSPLAPTKHHLNATQFVTEHVQHFLWQCAHSLIATFTTKTHTAQIKSGNCFLKQYINFGLLRMEVQDLWEAQQFFLSKYLAAGGGEGDLFWKQKPPSEPVSESSFKQPVGGWEGRLATHKSVAIMPPILSIWTNICEDSFQDKEFQQFYGQKQL